MTDVAIRTTDLGIRFRRNRRGRRSFKDLFSRSRRRIRPDEFWALREVSVDVKLAGERSDCSLTGTLVQATTPMSARDPKRLRMVA